MNIILITKGEKEQGLNLEDSRVNHLKSILKKKIGEFILIGIENEPVLYLASLQEVRDRLFFTNWQPVGEASRPLKLTLLLGLSRPLVMRRLLKDATTLSAAHIHVVTTDLSDYSYLQSSLWKGEALALLRQGAVQTRTTYTPSLTLHKSLDEVLPLLENTSERWVLHLDIQAPHLIDQTPFTEGLVLAIGSERGWTEREILLFKAHAFRVLSLGERVLRTETAVLASLYWTSEQLRRARRST